MTVIRIIISIAILTTISKGVTINGLVIDSTSGLPLSGVTALFRVGNDHPTATTDANGRFSEEVTVGQNYPLQIFFTKNGYLQKTITVVITGDTIDVDKIMLVKPAEFTAFFTGIVLDSVTRNPLPDVPITIYRKWNDGIPFLKCTTDTHGEFGILIPVSGDMNGKALWDIQKPGYYSSNGYVTADMDSVHQTISLRAEGSIRVQVSGKVLNAITGMPIQNAQVILRTTFLGVKADTSVAGSDGSFERTVEAGITSAAAPAVIYRISAPGYSEKSAMVTLDQMMSAVNLGDIRLSTSTSLTMIDRPAPVLLDPKYQTKFFLLNGRISSMPYILWKHYPLGSQTVITKTRKNTVLK